MTRLIIMTAISSVLSIISYFFTMRYNIHMFQLNGYKVGEHMKWLSKNASKQWVLYVGLIPAVLHLFFPRFFLEIIICLWQLLIILVFSLYRKIFVKKKIVYTTRVKRQIATGVVLSLGIEALVVVFGGLSYMIGTLMALACIQFLWIPFCGILNKPFEKAVSNYYINDAKRILKANKDMIIIGVTGSYGKTSFKFYLRDLLKEKYSVIATPESYNTPMGVVRTIREMMKPTHEIFICEMGARHVGDIKEICDIVYPHHGVITSIGPQHLETFFSIENIRSTKFELADALTEDGYLFLNGDNEDINLTAGPYKNKVFYYNTGEGEGYRVRLTGVSQQGSEFEVTAPSGESQMYSMKLLGSHSLINVCGAIAVANTFGISLKDLVVPVRRIESVPHRMQIIDRGDMTIIDDAFNSNPVGSRAAVETLREFSGTRILITPGMVELGDREEELNEKFGEYAADCCDYILLVGKDRIRPIERGVLGKGFSKSRLFIFDSFTDAYAHAVSISSEERKFVLLENDLPDNY